MQTMVHTLEHLSELGYTDISVIAAKDMKGSDQMETDDFILYMEERLKNAESDDEKLHYYISEYEYRYFQDMTFQEGSILHDFVYFNVADEEGVFHTSITDTQEKLSSIHNYCEGYLVNELPIGIYGRFSPEYKCIEISPQSLDNPAIILHEMIHAYEYALKEVPHFYQEMLFICCIKIC